MPGQLACSDTRIVLLELASFQETYSRTFAIPSSLNDQHSVVRIPFSMWLPVDAVVVGIGRATTTQVPMNGSVRVPVGLFHHLGCKLGFVSKLLQKGLRRRKIFPEGMMINIVVALNSSRSCCERWRRRPQQLAFLITWHMKNSASECAPGYPAK